MLTEVRPHLVRHDRRDRHGEQLRKNRERFFERDDDGGVIWRLDAECFAFAVCEGAGALDGIEWPELSALGGWIEHAGKGLPHLSGDERRAVVEADSAAQMKGVPQAVR